MLVSQVSYPPNKALLGVFLILFLVGMLPLEWFLILGILFLLSIANTRIRLSKLMDEHHGQ